MSYLLHAFLPAETLPLAEEAKAFLLDDALFDEIPAISIDVTDGVFREMRIDYDAASKPITLRRLSGEDAEAARADAADEALAPECESIRRDIEQAPLVLEWEVERSELDHDGWDALHLWMGWVLSKTGGWLYSPEDGILDSELKLRCGEARDDEDEEEDYEDEVEADGDEDDEE